MLKWTLFSALLLAACAAPQEDLIIGIPARPPVLPVVDPAPTDPSPQVIGGKGKEGLTLMERTSASSLAHVSMVRPPRVHPRSPRPD